MSKVKIILATNSKNRQDLFNMTGFKYNVVTSNVEEISNKKKPNEYVMELSLNKALSVRDQVKEKFIIISADEVIYCNNKIMEKPKSKQEVIDNMKNLSNNINYAYTGITIIDMYQDKILNFYEKTKVKFRKITDEEITWYTENEKTLYNCCGYTPLGLASLFIEKIEGDYNNLLGISPSIIYNKLKELGYTINDIM